MNNEVCSVFRGTKRTPRGTILSEHLMQMPSGGRSPPLGRYDRYHIESQATRRHTTIVVASIYTHVYSSGLMFVNDVLGTKRLLVMDKDEKDSSDSSACCSPLNIANVFQEHVGEGDPKKIASKLQLPYSLMVYNCHGDFNIGTLCRTASCLSVKEIFVVGRRKFDGRTRVGCQNYTSIYRWDDIPETFFEDMGLEPVFLEQGGKDLYTSTYELGCLKNPCFIVGSESYGIPEDLMKRYPGALRLTIPQSGMTRSLNVAASGSILLSFYYSILRSKLTI